MSSILLSILRIWVFRLAFLFEKKVKFRNQIISVQKGGRMARKICYIVGMILLLSFLNSCSAPPEEGLLKRYFSALTLNDRMTLSTMAIEPISIDAENWEITTVSEELIEEFKLPEMDANEKELQTKLTDHVGPVQELDDELWGAKEDLKAARTGAARRAAQQKVDEAQTKFDEERAIHSEMQKEANEAQAVARKEEEIAEFSLGAGDIPNIRTLSGEVFSKEVDISAQGKSGTKNYRFYLRRYVLEDEVLNLTHRGRWIIVRIESIG
jgi:hypothetical protein